MRKNWSGGVVEWWSDGAPKTQHSITPTLRSVKPGANEKPCVGYGLSGLRYWLPVLPGLLTGCGRAPTFDIIGSLFPAWIVCLVLGIVLAIAGRWLLFRLKVALSWAILVYPSLAAFFTFLLWLILFS